MAEKKHTAFALLSILQQETDQDHILTSSQLIDKLSALLHFRIERRTLYSNIEVLRQAGYEISDYNDNGIGYYLISRQFEKGEILLLCNAIHASHMISPKQSDDLIDKLLNTLCGNVKNEFHKTVFLPNRLKTDQSFLFYNLELLSEAITKEKAVAFTYMHYDGRKRLVPKRKEPYLAEPRFIVYQEGRPYLIATSPEHSFFIHYRIDKMKDPVIKEQSVKKLNRAEALEAYRYAENKLFMFSGDPVYVTLRCENRIMDQMIDLFGTALNTASFDKEHFLAYIKTTKEGAVFLAMQFLDAVEIVEPESLKDEMKALLKDAEIRYESGGK